MKINYTDEILKNVHKEAAKKNEKSADKQFAEILKETLKPPCESKSVSQNHPVLKSAPLAEVQAVKSLAEDKSKVVERVHQFLDLLNDYCRKLGNQQMSLKEVDPVINRLETENENLKPVLESLSDGDELKEILNNTLITASLEIIKYRNGEYSNG